MKALLYGNNATSISEKSRVDICKICECSRMVQARFFTLCKSVKSQSSLNQPYRLKFIVVAVAVAVVGEAIIESCPYSGFHEYSKPASLSPSIPDTILPWLQSWF